MIFNFIKNKDKSIKVSNIDDITDLLAEKINAKNDEVMLLTQENELLKQKLAASELTVSDYQKKISNQDIKLLEARRIELVNSKEIDRLHKNQESLVEEHKKKIDFLAERGERDGDTIQDYAEQIIELQNSKLDKKLKERNKELEKLLKNSESLIESNTIYRMTYEYISDESNRQTIIDNFSHNLSKWIKSTGKSDTEIAKKLHTTRSIVNNLRNGKRAVNVNTIQKFDIEL